MDNIETAATLLLRFVTVEISTTAQECLEKLLAEYAGPIIRKTTFFTLRSSAEEQDLEDVRSNVVLHLITRLRELRKSSVVCKFEIREAGFPPVTRRPYYAERPSAELRL